MTGLLRPSPILHSGELLREDADRYWRKAKTHRGSGHGPGPMAACWRCWPRLIPARIKWRLGL